MREREREVESKMHFKRSNSEQFSIELCICKQFVESSARVFTHFLYISRRPLCTFSIHFVIVWATFSYLFILWMCFYFLPCYCFVCDYFVVCVCVFFSQLKCNIEVMLLNAYNHFRLFHNEIQCDQMKGPLMEMLNKCEFFEMDEMKMGKVHRDSHPIRMCLTQREPSVWLIHFFFPKLIVNEYENGCDAIEIPFSLFL